MVASTTSWSQHPTLPLLPWLLQEGGHGIVTEEGGDAGASRCSTNCRSVECAVVARNGAGHRAHVCRCVGGTGERERRGGRDLDPGRVWARLRGVDRSSIGSTDP